jgi:hypothetical protein
MKRLTKLGTNLPSSYVNRARIWLFLVLLAMAWIMISSPIPRPIPAAANPAYQPASNVDLSVLGVDLNQAVSQFRPVAYTSSTPGTLSGNGTVAMVTGKDTTLRVYPRLLNANSLNGVSGNLTVYSCGNPTPLGPPLTPINPGGMMTASANPAGLQLNSTLNFQLPRNWVSGCLDLVAHLSAPPGSEDHNLFANNTLNWAGVSFSPVVPVNLVLAPFVYADPALPQPATPDILFTPMGALQWLNNAYPLPGNFPQDNTGVNVVRMLPMQSIGMSLFPTVNKDIFLGQLQTLLNNLRSQGGLPGNTRLIAMTPCGCGGYAQFPGYVSFVDTWAVENGPVEIMPSRFEGYGALWAQELGHNLGRGHAGNWHNEEGWDANFPYFHGGIGRYGLAINTEWWWNGSPFIIPPGNPDGGDGGAPHGHDFMSYGGLTPANTFQWVSDYTYNGLFTPLPFHDAQNRTEQLLEKVVIVGHLTEEDEVVWQPFYRVLTDYISSPGNSGEFSLELRDGSGQLLYSHQFDPVMTAHGDMPTANFSEFVPWQENTAKIVLTQNGQTLSERLVTPHTPTITLITPNGGQTLGDEVTVSWQAHDNDGDPLYFTVLYNSGNDSTWWPLATNIQDTSLTVNTLLLPGSDLARFAVRVTDGVNTAEDQSDGTMIVPDKEPQVGIAHPLSGEHIHTGVDANLSAAVYDAEDGFLPDDNLVWVSSLDGEIGHGHHVHHTNLTPGTHTLTLTAADSQGQETTVQVTVTVSYNSYIPMVAR